MAHLHHEASHLQVSEGESDVGRAHPLRETVSKLLNLEGIYLVWLCTLLSNHHSPVFRLRPHHLRRDIQHNLQLFRGTTLARVLPTHVYQRSFRSRFLRDRASRLRTTAAP